MFDGVQQQPQPPTATIAVVTALSAEEEALKRNTDCVYFLASPLTCKKGAECEYRHSDTARVNPRDCWFWVNGNCLNTKCGFRHPPLDKLLGSQVPTSTGSLLPSSQSTVPPATNAPYNSSKQGVPCIFFHKGYCLKGDRCPFLHATSSINKVPQASAATLVSEPSSLKKTLSGLEKCSQELKVPQSVVPKAAELLSLDKTSGRIESDPPGNGIAIDRSLPLPSEMEDELLPRYRQTNVPPTNGKPINKSARVHHSHLPDDHGLPNGKDTDEFSREPSPGFDVLVDDGLRGTDYYHNEDQFGRTRGHGGNYTMNDYDIGHSAGYDSVVDVDQDIYHDSHGYDSYEQIQGVYTREQHRSSSDRIFGGSARLESRPHARVNSPDKIDESDLRHHLTKSRKVNGLRSVINHDRARDDLVENRSYRDPTWGDAYALPRESSISNRLRGRIKLPGRSLSPVNGSDIRQEREIDKGRNRGRSPIRSQISSNLGRLQERIKGRVLEYTNDEGRTLRSARMRRETALDDHNTDFAGPKSLAELKGKYVESNDQQMNDQSLSLGKRKYQKLESSQQSGGVLSFEGPKPLSEILKRKRATGEAVSGTDLMSRSEGENQKEGKESLMSGMEILEPKGEASGCSNEEKPKSLTADATTENDNGLMTGEDFKPADDLQHNGSGLGTEDGMPVDEAGDNHFAETFDPKNGESDYEQVDGDDYNLDEGENAEGIEYLDDDDDDGDDFAKKIGVIFS